jgi:hypothetical protein
MRHFLLAAAAVIALSSPALATAGGEGNNTGCQGVGNPNSPCVPGSPGNSAGQGGQGGNATLRANLRAQANARSASRSLAVGQGGNATVNNTIQAGGDPVSFPRERLRVPDASAPAIWSNNPCVVALSGGVAVAGFGASIGAGIEDRDCTRRANAQHLIAMGEGGAAREVLCENREVRAAFQRVGRPCAADVPQVQSVSTVPTAPVAMPIPVAAAPVAVPNRPAYCSVPGIQNSECFR